MMHKIHLPAVTVAQDEGLTTTFIIEPLHRGFGITLGNALRRVLLSSLPGAAVTGFKVEGASHEFSTLEGVKEDLVQVILNLKQLRFRVFSDEPQTLELVKKGKGVATGKDIKTNADVEIVNPDQYITTLDNAKSNINMLLRVEKGRGYITVEEHSKHRSDAEMILIDSLFSPILRVRYEVERTRVGKITDLDKLVLSITTDGTISPEEALQQASNILVEQFHVIGGGQPLTSEQEMESGVEDEPSELNFSIEDLALSPRTTNALLNNEINSVKDLVSIPDSELKGLKGFGNKAYQEVVSKLKELELR